MTWIIRVPDGPTISTDDFTLGDLAQVEKETGGFWSVLNPFREVKVAVAFLRVAYRHADRDPDDVDAMTMKTLKKVFDFEADGEIGTGDGVEEEIPLAPNSHVSSRGASGGGNGRPKKPVSSVSVT